MKGSPSLVFGNHPITKQPMGMQDQLHPSAVGEVKRCVLDRKGQLIFEYEDGHLFVVRFETKRGLEMVCETYQPNPDAEAECG